MILSIFLCSCWPFGYLLWRSDYSTSLAIFKKDLIHLFLERRKGREKEEERIIVVREKHWLVASYMCSDWGLNLLPRYVPWPGVELATFCFVGWRPANWATPVRANRFKIGLLMPFDAYKSFNEAQFIFVAHACDTTYLRIHCWIQGHEDLSLYFF